MILFLILSQALAGESCDIARTDSIGKSVYSIKCHSDYANIVSDSHEKMWNLSLEQAKLEAEKDCENHGFCDYDIISRSRRIYACSFRATSKNTEASFLCHLSYREEKIHYENVMSTLKLISETVGKEYTPEVVRLLSKNKYDFCLIKESSSIMLRGQGVFFIYSKNRKWVVDKMEPDKFEAMNELFNKNDCYLNKL
jgi:hypothetical protein